MIYLDNAATTPVIETVKSVVDSCMDFYGNPSSAHLAGKDARNFIDSAKCRVMNLLGAKSGDIIFTSGGTESNNLALLGVADYLHANGETTIITSCIEHPSVLESCKELEKRGFNVVAMLVDEDGRVDIEVLDKTMADYRDNLGLVSIQTVNSEIGATQCIEDIGFLCREYGALFHTDAVQAVSCMQIDVEKCNIDMLSLSGHKIHTPKGIGALYVRDKSILSPIMYGGGQQHGLRSGTENTLGINALNAAAFYFDFEGQEIRDIVRYLRGCLVNGLKQKMTVPYYINGVGGSDNIVSLTIPKVEGNSLMLMLNEAGVCVSTGSACSSNKLESSYVLKAIGLEDKDAICTIRISLSHLNTEDEIDKATSLISELSQQLYELV